MPVHVNVLDKPLAAGDGQSPNLLMSRGGDDAGSSALVATGGIGDQLRLEATDEQETKDSNDQVLQKVGDFIAEHLMKR